MTRKLKFISLTIVTIFLTASLFLIASATNNESIMNSINANLNVVNTNQFSTDTDKISELTKLYFYAQSENYKSDNNLDLKQFFSNDKSKLSNIDYIKNKVRYFKSLKEHEKIKVLWDNVVVTINSININNNTAEVNAYVAKDIIFNDYKNGISSEGIENTVSLLKEQDIWKISNVISNDEFDKAYKNKNVDINQLISDINYPQMANVQIIKPNMVSPLFTQISYNRTTAANYASTYTDNTGGSSTSAYNSLFVAYSGNDCMNYGSQSLFAGFGGSYTSQSAINNKSSPMVTTPTGRQWWATSSTSDYNPAYGNGYNWANCIAFGQYFADSGNVGPVGTIYIGSISWADKGDLIHCRSGTTGEDWYHNMIVTNVSGTAGSRTLSNIWISAHTSNRKNYPLNSLFSSASYLRLFHISYFLQ